MSASYLDWGPSLVFLLALVLVSRFRSVIREYNTESYRNITGGLILFNIVGLAHLYHGLGMLDRVPFLSEALFYDLVSWVGVITGSILVVGGASSWLPLARNHREYNQTRIKRLETLQKVEQLIGVEGRLDTLLATTLHHLVEDFELSSGAVFKYDRPDGKLVPVSVTANAPLSWNEAAMIRLSGVEPGGISNTPLTAGYKFLDNLPEAMKDPKLFLPLVTGSELYGFFLLWSDNEVIENPEDETILRLAADVIARKFEADKAASYRGRVAKEREWLERLQTAVKNSQPVRDRVTSLLKLTRELIPHEYATLTVFSSSGRSVSRYSLGPSEQMLVESGLQWPQGDSVENAVFASGERRVSDSTEPPVKNTAAADISAKSVVAEPITLNGQTEAVLVLSSKTTQAFTVSRLRHLDYVSLLIAALVAEEHLTARADRYQRLMEKASQSSARLAEYETLAEVFDETAQLVSDEVSADMLRITTVDPDGLFLRSRALVCAEGYSGWVPDEGEMILSLMAIHRDVIEKGKPRVLNSGASDIELSEIESKQMFAPGIETLVIVPIKTSSGVIGLISMAGMNKHHSLRTDVTSLGFVKALANVLAGAIDLSLSCETAWGRLEREAEHESDSAELRNRMKSSITGMLGSVELIKSRTESLNDDRLNKYLSMLDRSARNVDTYVREELG